MAAPHQWHQLEVMAQARIGSLWSLQTTDALLHVLRDGYLDRYAEHGLRRADRVMVSANLNGEIECGWLLVESNEKGKVSVKSLNGGEAP